MVVKCSDITCKFNTELRLRGGAQRALCCKAETVDLQAEITSTIMYCKTYERKVADVKA